MKFSSKPNVFMHRFSTLQRQTLIYNSMRFFLFLYLISLLSHGNIKSISDLRHIHSHTRTFKGKAMVIFAVDPFERIFFLFMYTRRTLCDTQQIHSRYFMQLRRQRAFATLKKVFHVREKSSASNKE